MEKISLRLLVILAVIDFFVVLLFTLLWLFQILDFLNFILNAGPLGVLLIPLLILIFIKLRSQKKP